MSKDFQEALDKYREKVGEHLQETLAALPAELRAVLIALAPDTLQSLHLAMYQGPDRLGAIKLAMQITGLVSDKPKAPSAK
jgi:hypothetical protein